MKAIYKIIPVIFVIAALAGCSMGGETSVIRVNLGQAGNAKAVSIGELSHVIVFSGPTGSKTVNVPKGGGSVSVNVAPGTWTITVTAYYGEQVYAVGSATADVKAGKSTSVSIQMTVVWTDTAGTPDPRPQLSAQVTESALASTLVNINRLSSCVVDDVVYAYIECSDPDVTSSTIEWVWQVDGITVPADFMINPDGDNYTVQPDDLSKNITVIATHPKYQGSLTLGPLYVCRGLDSTNWSDFTTQFGTNAYPANGRYVLTDTITANAPVGDSTTPFTGTFDGNWETIDLSINGLFDRHLGLFASIGPSGIVKNLNISAEIDISPGPIETFYAGAIAGKNEGQIFNVSVTLDGVGIKIDNTGSGFTAYTGGIAGWNENAISNCSVDGTSSPGIFARNNTASGPVVHSGGIVGWNAGTVHHCWTLEVTVNSVGYSTYGTSSGSIAGVSDTSIQNCVAIGSSDITGSDASQAGRIWGGGNGTGSDNNYSDEYVTRNGSYDTGFSYNRNGEDIAPTLGYNVESWWTETAGWDSVWDGYDEAKPWVFYSATPEFWF